MVNRKIRDGLVQKLISQESPKISVYLPTHRSYPDNKQDRIVYKNQLQEIEAQLEEKLPRRAWQDLMGRMLELHEDSDFWNNTTHGLGVLAAGKMVETFPLDASAGPGWYMGEHFHLLPMYPLWDFVSHAFLADISRDRFRIFDVSRESIREVDLPEIVSSFDELFGQSDDSTTLQTGSFKGLAGAFYGHGGGAEESDKEREKYYRYLDDGFQRLNKDTGFPIILSGTQDSVVEFRRLAKGGFYLEDAITKPLEAIDTREALAEVKNALIPHLKGQLDKLSTEISNKRNENKTLTGLKEIREAAEQGRVDTLILPGVPSTSEQGIMDQAAEFTIMNGGTLYADSEDLLNLPTGRVALLRY